MPVYCCIQSTWEKRNTVYTAKNNGKNVPLSIAGSLKFWLNLSGDSRSSKNLIVFCRGDNAQIIWHFLQVSAPLITLIKCCDGNMFWVFFLPQKLWLFWNCDMTTALIFFRPGCLNVLFFTTGDECCSKTSHVNMLLLVTLPCQSLKWLRPPREAVG